MWKEAKRTDGGAVLSLFEILTPTANKTGQTKKTRKKKAKDRKKEDIRLA